MRSFGIYLFVWLVFGSGIHAEVATLNLGQALLLHPGWDQVSIETGRPIKDSQNTLDSERQQDLFDAALQYEAVLSEKLKAEQDFARKLAQERSGFTDAYAWQEYARKQREEFQAIWAERLEDSVASGDKWLGSSKRGRDLILGMLLEICEESRKISDQKNLPLLWHRVSENRAIAPIRNELAQEARVEPLRSDAWLVYEKLGDYPALRKETLNSWLAEFQAQILPIAGEAPPVLGRAQDLTPLVVQKIFEKHGITGSAANAIVQDLIHPLPVLEPEETP